MTVRPTKLTRALTNDLSSDGLLHNVVDDVRGGVVDATGLANLGFFLDLRLMTGRQTNHLAEKPLVDSSQDFHRHHAEVVRRAVCKVEALKDWFKHFVVDRQLWRNAVRGLRYAVLLVKMKKPGVVLLVGFAADVLA